MNELDITKLLELSEPMAVMIAINIVLALLKRVPQVKNWTLPMIAVVLGGVTYPLIADPAKVSFGAHNPTAALVITGVIIGYAAVGFHQKFKQIATRLGMMTDDHEPEKKVE